MDYKLDLVLYMYIPTSVSPLGHLFSGWWIPWSNILVILSTLAYTLASVAQWGRLSHMITVQLVEASYSFTALCVFVSFLLPSFHPTAASNHPSHSQVGAMYQEKPAAWKRLLLLSVVCVFMRTITSVTWKLMY